MTIHNVWSSDKLFGLNIWSLDVCKTMALNLYFNSHSGFTFVFKLLTNRGNILIKADVQEFQVKKKKSPNLVICPNNSFLYGNLYIQVITHFALYAWQYLATPSVLSM